VSKKKTPLRTRRSAIRVDAWRGQTKRKSAYRLALQRQLGQRQATPIAFAGGKKKKKRGREEGLRATFWSVGHRPRRSLDRRCSRRKKKKKKRGGRNPSSMQYSAPHSAPAHGKERERGGDMTAIVGPTTCPRTLGRPAEAGLRGAGKNCERKKGRRGGAGSHDVPGSRCGDRAFSRCASAGPSRGKRGEGEEGESVLSPSAR